MRLALLATAAFQIISGNRDGATVAGEGFIVALLPLADAARFLKREMPR